MLALALLGPVWGYGWVASKVALSYSPPLAFAALRVMLSALCLFAVLVAARRPLRPPPLGYTLAIGLLQTTAFAGLVISALHLTGAGRVSVLTYTMPFWLLLLAWMFLGERLRGVQWLAVTLAFTGLVLVVSPWRLDGVLAGVLTVLGGLAWAGSGLLVKILERRHFVDTLSLTAWQMLLGGVPLIVVAMLAREPAIQWTAAFGAALAYNVVLANAVAWLLWVYALRALTAGAAGLGSLAVPVVGVIAAWLQLGERPGAAEAAGMALIIAALAVLAARGIAAGTRDPGESEDLLARPLID